MDFSTRKRRALALIIPFAGILLSSLPAGARPQTGDSPGETTGVASTSGIPVPEKTDTTFTAYEGPGLDTPCTSRSGSPLQIGLLIDRYVAPVDTYGKLLDVAGLDAYDIVDRTAELTIPVYDVDAEGGGPCDAPEVDIIRVNGHDLGKPLYGRNQTWVVNTYQVPIEYLKFPALTRSHAPFDPLVAAENLIEVYIDTQNDSDCWCMKVDWVSIRIKAMAPVILVHGTNADASTWDSVLPTLDRLKVQDYYVNLAPNGSIDQNALLLSQLMLEISNAIGSKSFHLLTHSKGGLDARRMLSAYYNPETVRVLSLTTLAALHRGSPIADVYVHYTNDPSVVSSEPEIESLLEVYRFMRLPGPPRGPQNPAVRDQTVEAMRHFNAENVFPASVRFFTYSADADVDGDTEINDDELEGMAAVIPSIPDQIDIPRMTKQYRFLRYRTDVRLEWYLTESGIMYLNRLESSQSAPKDNDLVGTHPSNTHPSAAHSGPWPANHSGIKSTPIVEDVVFRIQEAFPLGAEPVP